jgi:hypothetical protein
LAIAAQNWAAAKQKPSSGNSAGQTSHDTLAFSRFQLPRFLTPSWFHDTHCDLHGHCTADVLALPQQQLQRLNRTSALPAGG